jgi:Ras-related GTP-binding protein A/B
MMKIPGTLYEMNLSVNSANIYDLELWHRKKKIFERSNLSSSEVGDAIQQELNKAGLDYPKNRIDLVVNQSIATVKPGSTSFIEGTVSEIIQDYQSKGNEAFSKILLMGLGNAGKTCIFERIFERKKPWELLHSSATKGISYRNYEISSSFKPVIWDLGGQADYRKTYHDQLTDQIFSKANLLLYVVDVSDSTKYDESAQELLWAATMLKSHNNNAKIYVFLHKIDTIQDKQAVVQTINDLFQRVIKVPMRFFRSSIFDESLFWAWSEIIQELYPKSTFLRTILKQAKAMENVDEILLIEKTTGLTVASTLSEESEEEVLIGMVSLLITTFERLLQELHSQWFESLQFHAQGLGFLMKEIKDSNMVLFIKVPENLYTLENDASLKIVKQIINQLALQIKGLW